MCVTAVGGEGDGGDGGGEVADGGDLSGGPDVPHGEGVPVAPRRQRRGPPPPEEGGVRGGGSGRVTESPVGGRVLFGIMKMGDLQYEDTYRRLGRG